MSGRAYTSAEERVEEIYKSWFTSRLKLIRQIRGKRRWLAVMESDAELAENSNFSQLDIENQAEQILVQIGAENESANESVNDSDRRLFNTLFKKVNDPKDVLNRRVIIHLLKNGGKVRVEPKKPRKRKNQKQPAKPMTLEERLVAKRVEVECLER